MKTAFKQTHTSKRHGSIAMMPAVCLWVDSEVFGSTRTLIPEAFFYSRKKYLRFQGPEQKRDRESEQVFTQQYSKHLPAGIL